MAETQQDQDQDDNDKRATRRFALRLPVSVRYGENEQERGADSRRQRAWNLLLCRFRHPGRLRD